MTYFMLADTLRSDRHVIVEVVVKRIPGGRFKQSLNVITSLLALGLSIFLLKESISFTVDAWETGRVSLFPSRTPMWIPRIFVPIGLGVFVLSLTMHTLNSIGSLIRGEKAVRTVDE
jgi:TRAP-type C4-dicarboxylate transport system permease small subunit